MTKLSTEQRAKAKETPIPQPMTLGETATMLAKRGYHVFPLRDRDKPPRYHGGHNDATTDPERIRAWWDRHPDANIGIACGASGIVVVDLDIHNVKANGVAEFARKAKGKNLPEPFVVTTGSGGAHLYYRTSEASARLKSDANAKNGIDIRTTGAHVVAPGCENANGTYRIWDDDLGWSVPAWWAMPPVAELAEVTEELAETVRPTKPQATNGSKASQGRGKPNSDNLADLLANPPAPGGRDNWLTKVCGHYAAKHWVANGEDGYAKYLADCQAAYELIPDKEGFASEGPIRSVWDTEKRNNPDRAPKGAPTNDDGERLSPAWEVMSYIERNYDVLRTTDGNLFAVPHNGPNRTALEVADKSDFSAQVLWGMTNDSHGSHSPKQAAITDGIALLGAKPDIPGPVRVWLRSADLGDTVVFDLAQEGNSKCVVITAEGWVVRDQPPKGVLFRRVPGASGPLPDPTIADHESLRRILAWDGQEHEQQWRLVRGWLAAALLAETERPLLLFHGPAGSAKTARALTIVQVIDPRPTLGSAFTTERDESVSAMASYVAGWDNLASKVSDSQSDFTARLVTGTARRERRLYSNNGLSATSYQRTGVMTAIVRPSFREDVYDRTITFPCAPLPVGQKKGKQELTQQFAQAHPGILAAVLTDLSQILRRRASTDVTGSGLRLMDYHRAVTALGPEYGKAYAESVREDRLAVAEDDDFVATVVEWLTRNYSHLMVSPSPEADEPLPGIAKAPTKPGQDPPNVTHVTPAEAYREASKTREREELAHAWWPGGPTPFSKKINEASHSLAALGWHVTPGIRKNLSGKHGGGGVRVYRIAWRGTDQG